MEDTHLSRRSVVQKVMAAGFSLGIGMEATHKIEACSEVTNLMLYLDTISDLRHLSTPEPVVFVMGYYVPGDGGGGIFRWDSTADAPEDGGTVFVSACSTTGRWKRDVQDGLNILWFGAHRHKIGRRIETENDAALRNALAVLEAMGGGRLYFPAGVYHLRQCSVVPENCTLQGDGTASVMKWTTSPRPARGAIELHGSGSRIIDLKLDLNFQNTNGIAVLNARQFVIDRVMITNGIDYGIWIFHDPALDSSEPPGEGVITNCDVQARDCYEVFGGSRVIIAHCIARGETETRSAGQQSMNGYNIRVGGRSVHLDGCLAIGKFRNSGFHFLGTPGNTLEMYCVMNNCQVDIEQGDGIELDSASLIKISDTFIRTRDSYQGILFKNSYGTDQYGFRFHNVTIRTEAGAAVKILQVTSDVEFTGLDVSTTSSQYLIELGGTAVRFRGGVFDLASPQGAQTPYAIRLNPSQYVHFENIIFRGAPERNKLFFTGSNPTKQHYSVTGCTIIGASLRLPWGMTRIQGNVFHDPNNVLTDSWYIDASDRDTYSIVGNIFHLKNFNGIAITGNNLSSLTRTIPIT